MDMYIKKVLVSSAEPGDVRVLKIAENHSKAPIAAMTN